MVQVYSNNVTVQPNSSFPFNVTAIEKGVTATVNNNTVQLNNKGVYMVAVNASLTPATTGETAIQLYKNGLPVAQAENNVTGTTEEISSLSFTTLVQCAQNNNPCCCCTSPDVLTVVNSGATEVTGDINVVVTKIC